MNLRQIRIWIAFATMFVVIGAAAMPSDTVGIAIDSAAVTLTSDTVADDTSDFVISTTIPRGFTTSLQNIFDDLSSDSSGHTWKFDLLGMLFGAGGILFVVITVILLFFPIILLAIIVWLLIRNNKRARKTDINTLTSPPDTTGSDKDTHVSEATAKPSHQQSYTSHRDNAIRNIAIGIGLIILFAFIDVKIGIGIGALIVCKGAGEYFIARKHRDEEER